MKQYFTGTGIFASAGALSWYGYSLRNTAAGYWKEFGGALEVIGHFISYGLYANTAVIELEYAIHGEITARLNAAILPNDSGLFMDLPRFGAKITQDSLLRDLTRAVTINKAHQAMPDIFDAFKNLAEFPYTLLPEPSVIGLIPGALFLSLPFCQDFTGKNVISSILNTPGGDTKIGMLYQNCLLPGWMALSTTQLYIEEESNVDNYMHDTDIPSPFMQYLGENF